MSRQAIQAPALTRHDPESRDVDFTTRALAGVDVKQKDPKRHYVLVEQTQGSMQKYRAMGYVIERRRADGPYIFAEDVATDGDTVEYMGHVLMSVDNAKRRDIEVNGCDETGARGSKPFDELEKRIVNGGGVDQMRGRHSRFGFTVNPLNADG